MYSGGAGLVGGGTNAAIQYASTGTVDMRDVTSAALTSAAGAYLVNKTGSLPLYAGERMAVELVGLTAINVTGAVSTAYIKGENKFDAGFSAAVGTITGYGAGYYVTNMLLRLTLTVHQY